MADEDGDLACADGCGRWIARAALEQGTRAELEAAYPRPVPVVLPPPEHGGHLACEISTRPGRPPAATAA